MDHGPDHNDLGPKTADRPQEVPPPSSGNEKREAELAHVLFIDIVGSSKLTTDQQPKVTERLNEVVRETAECQRARSSGQLISLPTGDGMGLVFLDRIEAPVACALEIARSLKQNPFCKVRMGINSGLVYVVADINGQRNVSGAGINRAERVMSCGDSDHVLLSENVADAIVQLSKWKDMVHPVGECLTKDGSLRVWSLHDGSIGNPATPKKAKRRLPLARRSVSIPLAAALIVGIAGVIWFLRPDIDSSDHSKTPERTLSYSFLVTPPDGKPQRVPREMMFVPGYGIQIQFSSPQDGFLYLVNEGPEENGKRTWTWLFPYPTFNNGSAALTADQPMTIPAEAPFVLDKMQGRELIHLIWTDSMISALEKIKRAVTARHSGGALAVEEIATLEDVIRQNGNRSQAQERATEMTVHAPGPILVKTIALEHI